MATVPPRSAASNEQVDSNAPDRAVVQRRIRERAAAIERRELDELYASWRRTASSATPSARRSKRLAAAIVDGLLATPIETIDRASTEDRATLQAALDVFDPDPSRRPG